MINLPASTMPVTHLIISSHSSESIVSSRRTLTMGPTLQTLLCKELMQRATAKTHDASLRNPSQEEAAKLLGFSHFGNQAAMYNRTYPRDSRHDQTD